MANGDAQLLTRGLKLNVPRGLYFLIFTVSGFSGLIYESIWSHYLKLFLGHAAYAQSLVLIIFMGGMALGSWLASRVSRRFRIPILLYAGAELIVGVVALLFHDLFTGVMDAFYHSILPATGSAAVGATLKWLAASLLITPQSILLGMTFPLMSAGILRRYPDTPGGSISMLYFTNSIGAAIGVLASGFWLIGMVGLPGTMLTAGLLNIALGLTVWALVRLDPEPETKPLAESGESERTGSLMGTFLVAAFITGAASFIYEIGWIRMLSLVLGATTHSFELMLSAFITGLAFGGLWIKNRIDRIASPIRFSGYVQIVMGTLAVLTIPVYASSFDWMTWLLSALDRTAPGFTGFTLASHVIALVVMLPTTFAAGMTLPLFTYALLKNGHGEVSIGRIYAANTLGAICGVLFAVHVGLPVLGLKSLIVFGALLDVVLGLYLLSKATSGERRATWQMGGALACLGIIVAVIGTSQLDPRLLSSGVFRVGNAAVAMDDEVIYYRDGKTASITLRQNPAGSRILSTNGKVDAAILVGNDEEFTLDEVTMIVAGALPIAYKPDARQVANIGMGSGQTTHTLLASSTIEAVDTIEIESAIVEASRGFGPAVARAYEDPRSRIFIEDAKTYFSLHNNTYDIIVAEPSNPWVSGVASLFSTEFYRTVKEYLADDGLFVQWIQLYEFNDELAVSILKALSEQFGDYVVYTTDGANILLIARNEGDLPEPDWDAVFAGGFAAELANVEIRTPDDLQVRKVAERGAILPLLASFGTPANSDYFPFVDLNAGRARYLGSAANLFREWEFAPFPLVQMLYDDDFAFSDLTVSASLSRLRNVESARWIHERITGRERTDAASANFLTLSARFATEWAALSAATCDMNDVAAWHLAVRDIVAGTLPHLDVADGLELLDELAAADCALVREAGSASLFELYRAVARRDAATMGAVGRDLLAAQPDLDVVIRRYLLSASMLGDIVAGRPDRADQTWASWGEQVYAEAGSVSGDLRLLRAIAADARETALAAR